MPFYKTVEAEQRINIYFEDIPPNAIRNKLKMNGWRWDPYEQCWWHENNPSALLFATSFALPASTEGSDTSKEEIQFMEKGVCGPNAIWMLSLLGQLFVLGSGEITGYDYDQIQKSPWYHVRQRIKTITVQEGITTIGKRAFYEFSELQEVELPDSVIAIEDRAFAKCKKLSSFRVPSKLKSIGAQAFRDCCSLREIHLPHTVSSIGEDCFKNWVSGQTIYQRKWDAKAGRWIEQTICLTGSDPSNPIPIYFEDFVTISNSTFCVSNNHFYETIQAQVNILRKDGTLKSVTVPAGYCRDCKKYTLGMWQFEKLRKMGIILCRMIQESPKYTKHIDSEYPYLAQESKLKQCGYSVNKVDDLSDDQRKQLLICLLESRTFEKAQIINHLSWLIQTKEGLDHMEDAIAKWKMDRLFVDSYKMGTGRVVALRSLRVRR